MTSINGLKNIAATSIQNSGEIYLGNDINPGTAGQALVSGGDGEPARWDTHTGTIQPLPIGTNLSLASGNATFDGGTADTLNASGGATLTGGSGIDITGGTITTDNDNTTINNSATGNKNQVLKVPNALTAGSNVSFSSGTTYDGSAAITISSTDTDTQLALAEDPGISITSTGGLNRTIGARVDGTTIGFSGNDLTTIKVPNALTAGTNVSFSSGTTYDGSSAITISSTDTDTQLNLTEGNGITITNTGGINRTIAMNADSTTLSNNVGSGQAGVLKVPNVMTKGTNINFINTTDGAVETTYDGSTPITISSTDTDTTYQGGTGISIDTTTNPDTINCANIPNSALANSTISGKALGTSLSTITFYSSTGAFLTSYNGADPPTSVVLDGNTQLNLTQGANIVITNTGGLNRTIAVSSAPTNLDLSSSTNTFPKFVGGSEILKSMSYIDNSAQNFNRIFNTSNEFFFSGSQDSGSDTLEIDFTATSTTGYCEYGFYANTLTGGMIFCVGIAAATGGTSPFSTTLTSSPVAIDAYKIGLFDGTTSTYSLKEILDFTSFENTYITSKFFFNNLSVGTRYRMALYGRCFNSGSIIINSGGKNTTGFASRSFHQPAFMKFYEYDSTIGGARTTGSGGDDY